MPAGKPVSQPVGEFHGREDMLSGSEVAQPLSPNPAKASRTMATQFNLNVRAFTMRDLLR